MERYCSITPNRGGERVSLLKFCADQIKAMGINNSYILNDPPKNDNCDLVPRIKTGIQLAKRDGFEWIFCLESDDAYPADYVKRYAPHMDKYDFIGDAFSTYFNLATRRWERQHHHGRASLYTTAFRVSAMDTFEWPADDYVFLDILIWKHAKRFRTKFVDSGALGIKGHNEGKVGGKGHRMKLANDDSMLTHLRANTNKVQFEFYTNLMKSL